MDKTQATEHLKEFMNELITQDNQGTMLPHLFLVKTKIITYGFDPEYTDEIMYVCKEDPHWTGTLEEVEEDIKEYGGSMDSYFTTGIQERHDTFSIHLTHRSAERFIEENRHHLTDPFIYLEHAWRNPEMKNMLEALGTLVDVPFVQ